MKKALSLMLVMLMILSSIVCMATISASAVQDSVSFTLDEGLVLNVNGINYNLVAKEMTQKKDGYSVKDYAETLFANSQTSSQTKVLLRSLLKYGAAAQAYFNYEANNPADAILSRTTGTPVIPDVYTPCVTVGLSVTSARATLSLDNTIRIVVEFVSDVDLTFMVDGVATSAVKEGTTYTVSIPVYAQNIDKIYTISASDGTVIQYSVLSYIKNKYSGASESLKALLGAIYDYNQAANAYVDTYVATITAADGTVTGYTIWADSIASGAAAGSTVTLYDSVASSGVIVVENASTFDLNGNTITLAGDFTANGTTLTVKDSVGDNSGVIDGASAMLNASNGGSAVLTAGYIKTSLGEGATVNGGKFAKDPSAYLGDNYIAGPVYATNKTHYANSNDTVSYYQIKEAVLSFNFNDAGTTTGQLLGGWRGGGTYKIEEGNFVLPNVASNQRNIRTVDTYLPSTCGFRYIEIRLSNPAATASATTYAFGGSNAYSAYSCGSVTYTSGSADNYVILTIDLTASTYFCDNPMSSFYIRLDAFDGAGTAYIDYIKFYEGPSLEVTSDKKAVEKNEEYTLNAYPSGGVAPYTYSWSDGTNIVGTAASVTFSNSVAGAYNYTCTVTDANNKSITSSAVQIIVADLAYSFNTNGNNEGWAKNICFGTAEVADGAYHLVCDTPTTTGGTRYDPQLTLSGQRLNGSSYNKCAITYKYDFSGQTAYNVSMFYWDSSNTLHNIDIAPLKPASVVSDEYVTIIFDTSSWDGLTISKIRLDICECPGTVYIDSIIFYAD